uniref:7 kDa protein n=1 Tax=Persimmon virus B TaxID=1493829 RepID=A0A0A8JCY5_9CLOS|nr:7 kDa protein [Persimmon virus B]
MITLFLLVMVLLLSIYAATVATYTGIKFSELNNNIAVLHKEGRSEELADVVAKSPLSVPQRGAIPEPL